MLKGIINNRWEGKKDENHGKVIVHKKNEKKKQNRFTFKSLPQRATYFQIVCLNISTKEPSVHQLFDELKDVCLNIFLLFHQIGKCQKLIIKKLAKLDVKDHNHQLPVCDWFVEVCWSFFVFLVLASYSMIISFYPKPLNFWFPIAIGNIVNLFVHQSLMWIWMWSISQLMHYLIICMRCRLILSLLCQKPILYRWQKIWSKKFSHLDIPKTRQNAQN